MPPWPRTSRTSNPPNVAPGWRGDSGPASRRPARQRGQMPENSPSTCSAGNRDEQRGQLLFSIMRCSAGSVSGRLGKSAEQFAQFLRRLPLRLRVGADDPQDRLLVAGPGPVDAVADVAFRHPQPLRHLLVAGRLLGPVAEVEAEGVE